MRKVVMASDGVKPVGRSDLPLFFFAGLLWLMAVIPTAMSSKVALDVVYGLYCVIASLVFIVFSADRGLPFKLYGWLCLFLSIAGDAIGLVIRIQYPTTVLEDGGGNINTTAMGACFIFPVAYLCVAAVVESMGMQFVGSSAHLAPAGRPRKVFWNPELEATMAYSIGPLDERAIVEQDKTHHSRYVERCLLHSRCHWSGEPVLDYIYWVANEHNFFGFLFCHPLHPFSTRERFVVLLITVCLIVFPVSCASLSLKSNALAPLWTLVVVTGPRNLLRAYLKQISTRSDELELDYGLTTKDDEVRDAQMWQVTVEMMVVSFNCAVCFAACVYIVNSGHDLVNVLLYNSDGLLWAVGMDLIFGLVMPKRASDNEATERGMPWTMGFFGRWCQERDLIASGVDLRYASPKFKAKSRLQSETTPLLQGHGAAPNA